MTVFCASLKPAASMYSSYNSHWKFILLCLLSLCFTLSIKAQWAKGFGGTRADFGQAVAIDATGNVLVTGNFAGTADFDPRPGVFNLTSNCPCDVSNPPNSDVFLAKYNNLGNLVWAFNIGGGNADLGQSVGVDAAGNVYVTGLFWGTADFDPGTSVFNLTSAGNTDIFLAKYDPNGNFVWANRFGNNVADAGYGLKLDATGNLLLTGSFFGIVDFDPGAGVTSFDSNGNTDVFFAKYNLNGGLIWAKDIAGTGEENGRYIDADAAGNVYVTGTFFGTTDFDPGPGTFTLTGAGSKDPFFAKYTAAGDLIWAKSIGAAGDEEARTIAVDAAGNLYAAGYFIGTTDFDPSPGTTTLSSAPGTFDGFLMKLNAAGDFQWAFKVGSTGDDIALCVAVDGAGNPYICGFHQNTIDLDPGPGTFTLTAAGNEGFFAKYSPAGNFIFGQKEGGPADEVLYSIAIDASDFVYLTGYFSGTPLLQTGAGSASPVSAGNADVLLIKYQPAAILPVNFISFTGKAVGNNALLQWAVSSERDSKGFEIEKSTQPLQTTGSWQKAGFVQSNGSSSTINKYEFPDLTPLTGKTFYRLKQVDADGHFTYSPIVVVDASQRPQYALLQNSPNPVQHFTSIRYELPENSHIKLAVYNQAGQEIMVLENKEKPAGTYTVSLDGSLLEPGIYYYSLQTNKSVLVRKMIVTR